ncbi:uncharacterized protein BDR25DRAFT_358331 [Lindgomyces ingoldianus]|uniref:Uncharacterized protein n=1 Tax=Lindgomyces ingoldianus TaxID=673940 RepID=A0ACB6QKV2_9PLEO|nr:uncharacterized protein BDR25DRAFT_358331 [Lindgomyces ingoldianus]KAF2467644.1 hypothetical protein BDR25DRAFT_358331 [Lindgomyces ingoldianus]
MSGLPHAIPICDYPTLDRVPEGLSFSPKVGDFFIHPNQNTATIQIPVGSHFFSLMRSVGTLAQYVVYTHKILLAIFISSERYSEIASSISPLSSSVIRATTSASIFPVEIENRGGNPVLSSCFNVAEVGGEEQLGWRLRLIFSASQEGTGLQYRTDTDSTPAQILPQSLLIDQLSFKLENSLECGIFAPGNVPLYFLASEGGPGLVLAWVLGVTGAIPTEHSSSPFTAALKAPIGIVHHHASYVLVMEDLYLFQVIPVTSRCRKGGLKQCHILLLTNKSYVLL